MRRQEDSCWPLSDDATLKKKFDDIFAATQYTKALEEIRKFKNQKKQDEKTLGLELATLEERLGTANKLREEQAKPPPGCSPPVLPPFRVSGASELAHPRRSRSVPLLRRPPRTRWRSSTS